MAGLLYSRDRDYKDILEDVHSRIQLKLSHKKSEQEALELQTILQEIKRAAADFNNVSNSIVGQELENQYKELITLAFSIQSKAHSGGIKINEIFRRANSDVTPISMADDIFEEDLAAILTAGEILGGNENISMECFLFGGKSTGTRATKAYNLNELVDDENVETILKKLAEKEEMRVKTQVKDTAGKVDVRGKAVTLNYSKNLPVNVQRLMYLMKDATFSAKNYSSNEGQKLFSEIGLHLGQSNLYKAITGALSEVQMGHKQQKAFFFRGANTILNNNHGYGEIAATHFSHLRFIYELRGSGLLDENNHVMPVKFLIYNDPSSDAIFVKSTASIILEALEKANRGNNLLGSITLSASQVQSKKT